jgi:hypothetical protein
MIRGTANESDDRQRINNVAMLDGPIDREEDIENTDREENKDLEQENDELKVRLLLKTTIEKYKQIVDLMDLENQKTER